LGGGEEGAEASAVIPGRGRGRGADERRGAAFANGAAGRGRAEEGLDRRYAGAALFPLLAAQARWRSACLDPCSCAKTNGLEQRRLRQCRVQRRRRPRRRQVQAAGAAEGRGPIKFKKNGNGEGGGDVLETSCFCV
jgi:hypothetical protein